MNEKIKTLSLFAGIGGIDLGLEATGYFETVQFVEYDPYCQHILKRHWPDVPIWGDVKTFDPDSCGEIDCIVGGYPCQPFSVAGKQKGTQDDRHLWPRMFEIIKHKRPSLILCENVSGHIVLGLDEVLLDLEGEGYSTRAFVIPASAVDANHKRERVWIVAFSDSNKHIQKKSESNGKKKEIQGEHRKKNSKSGQLSRTSQLRSSRNEYVAYANNTGHRTSQHEVERKGKAYITNRKARPQSQSSRQSTDVANTNSEARGNTRGSGEAERELQPQEQEGSTMGSEVTGCGGLRGEAKDVANTQSFGSDGREHQHDTEENREKGAIGSKVRRESSTENVANSQDIRHEFSTYEEKQRGYTTRHSQGQLERDGADVPNTQGKGLEGQRIDRETSRSKETGEFNAQSGKDREQYQQGSIERRLGGVVDGVSLWMDEPDIPRVTTNQTGRVQRLKMLGNAVVPQVVYQLGLAMKELWDEV